MTRRTYVYGRHAFVWDFDRNAWWNDCGTVVLDEDMPDELRTGLMDDMPPQTATNLALALRGAA